VVVAVANPLDDYAVEALQLATGKRVVWQVGVASEIESAFQRQYTNGTSSMAQIVEDIGTSELDETEDIRHLKDLASEAPIIRVVNLLITRALECSASDIHIEPFENALKVRYRVDGVLRDVEAPPVRSSAAVISRIKVMANLNIAERRLPQDGRIRIRIAGREFDMRISTTPTMHGESVVMRILDKATVPLDFRALGFASELLPVFEELLMRPHGIILSTGPTGSGKTTTLYAALSTLNTPDRKVVTVEDPVEYQLNGINQIQIKPQIGLTFANALRSILRQDPDVIMVGEMRDLETCKIAVQAALTGHKVFSTLHTNDAASSVTRLLDMGIEDYLLTSTLNGVLAQRLVRTLCPQCKKPYLALPELAEELRLSRFSRPGEVTLFEAVGCGHCDRSGYRGRTSILELLVMSDPVRQIVLNRGDAGAINRAAVDHGMTSMYEDGLRKAVAGLTTIEEVVRVTQES
jgi:general secretion pathway protein E